MAVFYAISDFHNSFTWKTINVEQIILNPKKTKYKAFLKKIKLIY
jgi:hypothetical protein